MTEPAPTQIRRIPAQRRSRERVEHILNVVEQMIVEHGIAELRMNEIAVRAGVPIGSVYQYFSGREDLVASLLDRYHGKLEQQISHLFNSITSVAEFVATLLETFQIAWQLLDDNPVYQEIWCGAQTWKSLRERDWADSLVNAETMAKTLARLLPATPIDRLRVTCVVLCDAGGSIARMSHEFPEMRDALRNELLLMFEARLVDFFKAELRHTIRPELRGTLGG